MALAYDTQPTDEQLGKEQDKARREEKLVRLLKAEEEEALGFAQTETTEQHIEALDRYFGKTYGDEEDGRSKITTREVMEAIEWTRPDLMRVFASGGNVCTVEENQPEDAKYAKDAADYLQWMFFSDNPGFELLDDFAFDGLLHRRGYMCVYWCDYEYAAPQTLTGLDDEQVMMLAMEEQAGRIKIEGQELTDQGMTLIVHLVKTPARAIIETVAPEDMRLNGRAVNIDQSEKRGGARYVGRLHRMLRGEIAREWPDKKEEIQAHKGDSGSLTGQARRSEDVRQTRFGDQDDDWETNSNEAAQEMEVLEEYIRADLNDDGYPELIRAYRLGDLILEEGEVEENPFASWTPIRIPHRFMGLSMHDLVTDLQRVSTVVTRAGLDALYQSVVNREAYDKNKVGLDSLLATYSGAKVEVDGPPGDAILPLTGGLNTATVAWEALEVVKQRLEDRTGATRQTRGLDSEALNKEHSGKALQQLQINADARKEMVARNMANGLAQAFGKLYRLVCRNQNTERSVKVGGKWAKFDPRTWNSDLRVTITAGGVNRDGALQGLMLIGQEQEKVIETLGPGNPNVTSKNRYRYQEELTRHAGFRDASPFFTEVPDEPETDEQGQPVMDEMTGQPKMKPWAPPPQPDPAMAKVEADAKAKQAEMELSAQESQATLQLKGQEAQANLALQDKKDSAQLAHDEQRAALELQLAQERAAAEIQLAREKASAEIELAWAKFEAEMALAREKQAAEIQLAREQTAHQREMHTEDTDAKREMHTEKVQADVKISKNREGGSLSE